MDPVPFVTRTLFALLTLAACLGAALPAPLKMEGTSDDFAATL